MKETISRGKKGKQRRKKLTALLLCLLMLLTLVENVAYYPIAEKGDGQTDVATEMDASALYSEELPVVAADGAGTSDVRELPNSTVQVVTYVNGVETSITDAGVLKNGDRIEVQLAWRIDNTGNAITADTDLTYDLMATGVTISNTGGEVLQAGAAVGVYRVDDNGILHINITNSNLLSQSDITGNVNIQGVINVSGLPEDDKGQVKAEIAGTTITVQKSDPTGAPSVNKQKSGSLYTDADGRIYQDFAVNVTVNGSSNELVFTDTMGAYLSLVDGSFKVDGKKVTPTVSGSSISHVFSPVSKNNVYHITYTAEIDKSAYGKDFNSWDSGNEEYYNTAKVKDQFGSDSSRVFALDRKQWISKSNWVDNNAKTITWQITVNSGDAIDISGASVKDTLPDGLELVGDVTVKNSNWQTVSSINGTAINGNAVLNGGFTFPDGAAGMYIFEYTTKVTEGSGGFADALFTNKAEISTDYFGDPKTAESTATISNNWVQKKYIDVNKTDKEITWETVITVPEGQNVNGLSYADSLGTGLAAKEDGGAFNVNVAYSGAGEHTEAAGTVSPPVTGNQFTVPLGNVKGPLTITVTYTTTFDPGTNRYFDFVNKGWLKSDGKESKPVESTYRYEDDSVDILNYKWRVSNDGTKATWGIAVKDVQKLKEKLEADPTKRVYIYDTVNLLKDDWTTKIDKADAKITLVDDSVTVTSWPNVNYGITGMVLDDGRTIKFDITDQIKKGSYSNFDFQYTLDIDGDGIKYMMDDANNASTILEKNKADAYIITNGNENTKEEAGSYESNDTANLKVGDILTKNCSYTTATAPNAIYTIEINPNGYTLTAGGNGTLELEDVLGEKLQMKLATLKVTDESGTDVTSRLTVNYSPSTRTLKIVGIPDATHYTLSYSVYVNVEYKAGSTFESLGVSDGVSNACRLFTNDDWETSVNKAITGNVLKSSATANSNYGSITISKYCAASVLGGAKFELTPYRYSGGKFVLYGNERYNKDFPDATPAGKEIVTDTAKGEASVFLRFDTLYVLTETEAPAGYQKLTKPMYIIIRGQDYSLIEDAVADWEAQYGVIDIKDSGEYHYVENKESSGYTLTINKSDMENLPVEGAGFTLYEYTGGRPDYDSEVNSGYTDANGKLIFDIAEEGTYWLAETHIPSGYVSSFSGKLITISEAGGTVNVTENIKNEKLYGKYTIKKCILGTTQPLQNVEFGLYVEDADGNKVLQKTGTTDVNGELVFDKLELGTTYYIKEEKTVDGYIKLDKEWSFKPEGNAPDAPGLNAGQTIYNEAENGSIKITKADADKTGKRLEGAEFTLYDSNKVAVMKNGLPVTVTTGSDGIAEFTGLRFGTYYVRETKAPGVFEEDGIFYQYQIDDTYYKMTISDNIAVTKTITNKALRLNAPYISFKFYKNGVMPDGSTVVNNLAGATFRLYRGDGTNKTLAEIQKMELLSTAVSDASGTVYFLNIHNLGKNQDATLTLVETSAPTGYYLTDKIEDRIIVLNPTDLDNHYAHDNKYDPAKAEDLAQVGKLDINGGDTVSNYRITGEVTLTKFNETGVKLSGAKYGLYKADHKIDEAVTDGNGVVSFEGLNYGETYIIRETAAPDGYTLSDESFSITVGAAAPTGGTLTVGDKGVYAYAITAKDKELSVAISKKALSEAAELPGATLKLYDSKNFEIDSWISGSTPHIVDAAKLQTGGIYTLKEISAPSGYAYSEDVTFQVLSDGKVKILSGDGNASASGSVVTMRDRRINFSLAKVDEGGSRVGGAKIQILTGDGSRILYGTTTVTNRDVVINPSIAGNIGITVPSEADGYSHYIYRESEVPSGYKKAVDIHFCIDHYGRIYLCDNAGNNRTLVADNKIRMVDDVDTSYVFISKGYSLSNNFVHIKGAVLKIQYYDDAQGEWIDMADTGVHVYSWTSTNDIKVFESGAFTVGTKYRLFEEQAPFGYRIANPIEFEIETDGTENRVMVNNAPVAGNRILMEDAPVYLEIDKRRQESGYYLSGATLEILNSSGQRIHFWNTGAYAEKINLGLLKENEEYVLRESKAPYGYTKADDIIFKVCYNEAASKYEVLVKNAQNQFVVEGDFKLTMYDRLSQISVSKYDLTGKKELDGAKLVITEEGSARVVRSWTSSEASGPEKFNVLGTFDRNRVYKLTEESAPYGFALADAIYFKLDESNQIWVSDKANGTFTKQDGSELVMVDARRTLSISKTDITSGDEISGAKLVITDKSETVVVPEWSSSASGAKKLDVLQYFKQDEIYTLTEITAPFGYELAESIDFKIDENGDIYWKQHGEDAGAFTKVSDDTIVMEDAPKLLFVSKIDLSNSEELAGARLTITDSAQQVIDSWTSSDSGKHEILISEFMPNTEYTLTEITAPNGYELAENIIFKFDENGSIYIKNAEGSFVKLTGDTIVMKDAPAEETIRISKVDITNSEEIDGAELIVTDENGDMLTTWISSREDGPKLIAVNDFKVGTVYTLTEITAPYGYEIAENILFKLDAEGNLWVKNAKDEDFVLASDAEIVMEDAPKYVKISKVDLTNDKELIGAKLIITDAEGNRLDEWISSGQVHEIPVYAFEYGKEYTLTEITAPDGYEVAESIVFMLDGQGNVYVKRADGTFDKLDNGIIVMKDARNGTSVNTGDVMPLGIILAVMLISVIGLILLALRRRKI